MRTHRRSSGVDVQRLKSFGAVCVLALYTRCLSPHAAKPALASQNRSVSTHGRADVAEKGHERDRRVQQAKGARTAAPRLQPARLQGRRQDRRAGAGHVPAHVPRLQAQEGRGGGDDLAGGREWRRPPPLGRVLGHVRRRAAAPTQARQAHTHTTRTVRPQKRPLCTLRASSAAPSRCTPGSNERARTRRWARTAPPGTAGSLARCTMWSSS